MVTQLTAGQTCLLKLMQQKLLSSLKLYSDLRMAEKGGAPGVEEKLASLRERIKRISARQKRFTSEIINGNGNNTIPKENYFRALGLVTKDILNQLTSKSSERRRRTTANPRFSHDAIQAKKALQKPARLEPRVSREKRAESARSSALSSNNNNNNNNNNSNNSNSNRRINNNGNKNAQQKTLSHTAQAATNRSNASSRQSSSDQEAALSPLERQILYEKFKVLQQQLDSKASLVREKMRNIKRFEADNLRLMDVMERGRSEMSEEDELDYRGIKEALERAARNFTSARQLSQQDNSSQPLAANGIKPDLEGLRLKLGEDPDNQGDALMRTIEAYFKCEESLDGID